ncbi:hypothetical protein FH972_000523 [Carpinus fangiana]|uniref:Protein E6 n=1 Tax=Carpinus fangiana TaxID=176857 RepID=A0A5N6QBK5_9ROSI|nr:hypothetical protein FH972_000523 [Carpinus fangiana]
MASSATFTSFLFLLTLFFSMQIHARESQFFSKFTNNNAKETPLIPNKEETTTKQNQEPTFIPETQGGYGLYGHESGQFPPTTTTPTHVNAAPYTTKPTRLPYKNEFDDEESLNKYLNTNDDHNNNNNENKNYYYNTNGNKNKNYYFDKNTYDANQYGGFGDTKLTTERGYSTMANQNNYNERQGMSDTRFMENGKYYYDINGEKYNPNQYRNSKGTVASRNWDGNKGYYGNKGGYYGNNENSFEHSNSMEGYQNEEEFQEEQNEFEP